MVPFHQHNPMVQARPLQRMTSFKIPLDAPNIGREEIEAVRKAIESGFVSSAGPLVREFERAFASYLGVEDAVAVQSGTAALHLALLGLGIGPGDEVILPATTFVASANVIRYVGAKPVFADILPDTWTLNPATVERAITTHTKAIMPVHLYGVPCHMDELTDIGEKYGLNVIEDVAEALGAKFNGTPAGCMGDVGCFSFNGNKIITTGGGGMLVARDKLVLERIRLLSIQAKEQRHGAFFHREVGYNYRMNNIAAAIGLTQLYKLPYFLKKKREINAIYRQGLEGWSTFRFQLAPPGAEPSWWLTAITLKGKFEEDILHLMEKLSEKGIQSRRIFPPLVNMPPYDKNSDNFSCAQQIFANGICLPSSTLIHENQIIHVIEYLKKVVKS